MTTYESKLSDFADGKMLVRLAHTVRDRADAQCDACGSMQPRTLTGLKDQDSGRCFFVGVSCLKELMNRRVISRGFGRDSGPAAYDTEMKARSAGPKAVPVDQSDQGTAPKESLGAVVDSESTRPDSAILSPMIAVVETQHSYRAFAYIVTDQGILFSSGFAEEPRYREVWQIGGDGGLVMERVSVECADALDRSVGRAWREACAGLRDEQARALPWKELPPLQARKLCEARLTSLRIDPQTVVRKSDPGASDTAEVR